MFFGAGKDQKWAINCCDRTRLSGRLQNYLPNIEANLGCFSPLASSGWNNYPTVSQFTLPNRVLDRWVRTPWGLANQGGDFSRSSTISFGSKAGRCLDLASKQTRRKCWTEMSDQFDLYPSNWLSLNSAQSHLSASEFLRQSLPGDVLYARSFRHFRFWAEQDYWKEHLWKWWGHLLFSECQFSRKKSQKINCCCSLFARTTDLHLAWVAPIFCHRKRCCTNFIPFSNDVWACFVCLLSMDFWGFYGR